MAHLYLLEETKCLSSVYGSGRDIKCTGYVEEAMVKDAVVDTLRSGHESQVTYEPNDISKWPKNLPGRLEHICMRGQLRSQLRSIHKRERSNGAAAIGWAFSGQASNHFRGLATLLEVAETFQQRPQLVRAKQIQ